MKNKYLVYLLVIVLGLSLKACGSIIFGKSTNKKVKEADSYKTVEYAGMTFEIPDYYGENISNKDGEMRFEAESGNNPVDLYFMFSDREVSEKDFSSKYETVVNSYLEAMESQSGISDFQTLGSKEYKTSQGEQASETNYKFKFANNNETVSMDGIFTMINNKDHKKVLILMFMQSQEAEYDYSKGFRKLVDEAKPLEVSSSAPSETAPEATPPAADSSAIRPEFKQTMDNYEAWFDHYCEVMKAYKENPSDMNLMIEMTNLLSEEAAMLEEMNKMDQSRV